MTPPTAEPVAARRLRWAAAALSAVIALAGCGREADEPAPLRVAAAVSLGAAAEEIAGRFEREHGVAVEFTFGPSGRLAGQVAAGAPIDVFLSAGVEQIDGVRGRLADDPPPRAFATNAIVLVVPRGAAAPPSLGEVGGVARLAVGDPSSVPAGKYAMQALRSLGTADALAPRIVHAASVRQVLDYVARGEVDAGFVYATEARGSRDVEVVASIDPALHDPVAYVAGAVAPARPAAAAFVKFLSGEAAAGALRAHGFVPVAATVPMASQTPQPARRLLGPLLLTLQVAIAATLLAAVVATPLAWLMARRPFPGKSLVEAAVLVPLVLPPTVLGYLLVVVLGRHGPVGAALADWFGYGVIFRPEAAVLAAAVVAVPLFYLPTRAAFASVDRELEDLATLLGAGRLRLFWHVSLPLARRGIAGGLILAFARAAGEFGATAMVLGVQPGRLTLPILVWADYERGDLAAAAPAVMLLAAASLALVLVYNRTSLGARD